MITSMMNQIKISKSSSNKKGSPKSQDITTVVHTENYSDPTLYIPHYYF